MGRRSGAQKAVLTRQRNKSMIDSIKNYLEVEGYVKGKKSVNPSKLFNELSNKGVIRPADRLRPEALIEDFNKVLKRMETNGQICVFTKEGENKLMLKKEECDRCLFTGVPMKIGKETLRFSIGDQHLNKCLGQTKGLKSGKGR